MIYDFDKVIDRRGTDSLKWNVGQDMLPMWVADMDFETAPAVKETLISRANHGIFGYSEIPHEWYEAYISWWERRHGFSIDEKWLIFCTGVVPAISSMVRKLTTPAEKVVVMTPVYNIFFNSILNNGRVPLEAPLVYSGGEYHIDFEDLEKKLSDPQATLLILCNPQNPAGKIWSREELAKIASLAKRHNVTVISDEIHCDLTAPGRDYIPFASVNEDALDISVTCVSPTKAFNIAGIQTAAVFCSNDNLRHKVWRGLNTDEVAEPNSFATVAAISAFNDGEEWLDELRGYIEKNKRFAGEYISKRIPDLYILPQDATYLMWIDCSGLDYRGNFARYLKKEVGLFLSDGKIYHGNGEKFVRLNVACPRITLEKGLIKLENAVLKLKR